MLTVYQCTFYLNPTYTKHQTSRDVRELRDYLIIIKILRFVFELTYYKSIFKIAAHHHKDLLSTSSHRID